MKAFQMSTDAIHNYQDNIAEDTYGNLPTEEEARVKSTGTRRN